MSSLNEEGREFVRSLSRGDEIGRQVVQAIADADANAAALRDQTEGAVASAGALEAAWRSVGDAVNTVARGEVRAALAAASYEHRGDPIAQAEARARIEWGAEYGDPTQAPAELRGAMEDLREQHVAYARAAAESQEALRLWNEEQRKAAAEGRKAGRSGESEIVREAKRLERENEARQEYISSLVFEASMVGATSLEQAKANALRRLGAEATAEQRAQAEGWIEAIHREREALRANEEAMQHLKDVSRDVLQGITQDLIDGASAADILSNALLRVAQSMVQTGIDSLIEVGIGAFGNAIGGGGGRLPAPTAQNLSWVYHDGGIVGQDGRPRMVDSSVFAGAPRYHSGVAGLAPDEVPAILQRGERIIPRGGSDQKLEVHIHENAADGQHQVQHSPGRLDIRLAKQALGDMVRGGGLDSAMTQRFGVRPKAMGG